MVEVYRRTRGCTEKIGEILDAERVNFCRTGERTLDIIAPAHLKVNGAQRGMSGHGAQRTSRCRTKCFLRGLLGLFSRR